MKNKEMFLTLPFDYNHAGGSMFIDRQLSTETVSEIIECADKHDIPWEYIDFPRELKGLMFYYDPEEEEPAIKFAEELKKVLDSNNLEFCTFLGFMVTLREKKAYGRS